MSSRLATDVSFSLEEFSRHGGLTGPHRDGWGIAYYDEGDVRLIREPSAASDSEVVRFVAAHSYRSDLVISHIRKATQGLRGLKNTQPFVRELGGRVHTFAHNGMLHGVSESALLTPAGTYRPVGTTDSEVAFCALLSDLSERWLSEGAGVPSLEWRFKTVSAFAKRIAQLGPANFLYSDGDMLFAFGHRRTQVDGEIRPPGLFTLCRSCSNERTTPPAIRGLSISAMAGDQEVALVASVRLTDEDWRPLEKGELIAMRSGQIVRRGMVL